MIIVEGPDGAGKTTLVNRLSDDLSLEIGQRGVKNRDELWKSTREDTYRALAGAVHGPVTIWDRLYFSEPIYSAICRRPNQFSHEDNKLIERLLGLLKPIFILCLPPIPTVELNIAASKQMDGVTPNIHRIYKWYEELYLQYRPEEKDKGAAHAIKAIKFDYTQDPYDYILRRCTMYVEKRGSR